MPLNTKATHLPERDDVSLRLAEQIPIILDQWEERVRAILPAARDQEAPLLRDHIPKLLLELAHALAPLGLGEDLAAQIKVSRKHGAERARTAAYSLQQVLCEYRILRKSIIEVLQRHAPLQSHDREVITDAIEWAMEDAGDQYVLVQQRALRASQERLVGLQVITEAALAHLPPQELLSELLARVCDVLTADTAVVLLRDGEELVVRAAGGFEEAVDKDFRVRVGEGFAGKIAASGEPLVSEDGDADGLVSVVAREKGVRCLLGVPLVVEGRVIGVLQVGSVLPHRFTEQDAGLLQLAGDRAALALDHARLLGELQAGDGRRNEFLTIVAHELRTPLSAISNALFILENIELPDDRAGRQVLAANRQTRQLARLVEDLMDVSRISLGKIELRREPVPVGRVAREAAETVRPLAEARGQELACTVPTEELMVHGDPGRLEQIFGNLLNNAVKYTEPGGRISLTAEREADQVVVRVRDTGIGIEPLLLPQVFELFRQLDPVQARSQGGLGIGLTLVKRLAQLHGGTVEARSSGLNQGTEFEVRLPLVPG